MKRGHFWSWVRFLVGVLIGITWAWWIGTLECLEDLQTPVLLLVGTLFVWGLVWANHDESDETEEP